MKKVSTILTALAVCFVMLLPMTVSAASASASLTGSGTVRAGDTITLSFNLERKQSVRCIGNTFL